MDKFFNTSTDAVGFSEIKASIEPFGYIKRLTSYSVLLVLLGDVGLRYRMTSEASELGEFVFLCALTSSFPPMYGQFSYRWLKNP